MGSFDEVVFLVSPYLSLISTKPPSTNPSSYSSSSEILQYFKELAEKYDLMKYIKLKHKVVGAWWMEETQEWRVRIQRDDDEDDVFEDRCHVLINAGGVLK